MRDSADNLAPEATLRSLGFTRSLLLWAVFALVCFGLGYPAMNRYDPTQVEGLTDTIVYRQMVTGPSGARPRGEIFGTRILLPYTARLFYWTVGSRLKSWNPVAFSLLAASTLFCATTAVLLAMLGQHIARNIGASLLAATLYLLNFAVPNLQLAGLVDSAEALFMLALAAALLFGKWWLLPIWGVLGVLAKETFLPFAAVFAVVWWITAQRHHQQRWIRLGWIAGMLLAGSLTMLLVRRLLFGHIVWPWEIAAAMGSRVSFLPALFRCVTDRGFWYVFVWLLPLGLLGLRRVPRPWSVSATITALVALAFGGYNDMAGTVARPMFDIVGPILSLSTALFLIGWPISPNGMKNVDTEQVLK